MLQIQRFPIEIRVGQIEILMPEGAQIINLSLDPLKQEPRLYVVADGSIKMPQVSRKFLWSMVGDELTDPTIADGYVGTVARNNTSASAVFHLFELVQ